MQSANMASMDTTVPTDSSTMAWGVCTLVVEYVDKDLKKNYMFHVTEQHQTFILWFRKLK